MRCAEDCRFRLATLAVVNFLSSAGADLDLNAPSSRNDGALILSVASCCPSTLLKKSAGDRRCDAARHGGEHGEQKRHHHHDGHNCAARSRSSYVLPGRAEANAFRFRAAISEADTRKSAAACNSM
jgi:hypothetical protein